MAYIWLMAIELSSQEEADALAQNFDTTPIEYGFDDILFSISSGREQNPDWWSVIIIPYDAETGDWVSGSGGPESVEHARLLTYIGNELYRRLEQYMFPFNMALVGTECSSYYAFGDRSAFLKESEPDRLYINGLVISEELWEKLGQPNQFQPLPNGTYWIPWKGESYDK